jgi:hypothetical protein
LTRLQDLITRYDRVLDLTRRSADPRYLTPMEELRLVEELRRQKEALVIVESCKKDIEIATAEAAAAQRVIAAATASTDPFDMSPLLARIERCRASIRRALRHLPQIANKIGCVELDSRISIIVNLTRVALSVEEYKCTDAVEYINSIVTSRPLSFELPNAISMVSLRLTRLATLTVHPLDRARYQEEWTAELAELAAEPRRTQIAYSLRLLLNSVKLRSSSMTAHTAASKQ